jgi:hypothetical protein
MSQKKWIAFSLLSLSWPVFPQTAQTGGVREMDGDFLVDTIADTVVLQHSTRTITATTAAVPENNDTVHRQSATIPDTSSRPRSAPAAASQHAAVAEATDTAPAPKALLWTHRYAFAFGLGYNQLFWFEHNTSVSDCYRTAFELTPDIRISLRFLYKKKFSIAPFIEYNVFGGTSAADSTGYSDQYRFYAIGSGAVFLMHRGRCEAGIGAKINAIVQTVNYSYYDGSDKAVTTVFDRTAYLPWISVNLGTRIGYSMGRWILSNENWFGITDLLHGSVFQAYQRYSLEWASAYEMHYRLLLTYYL